MERPQLKVVGTIKLRKSMARNGVEYFQGVLASNKDYKTKESLIVYCLINFREREMRTALNDGDIVEIVGRLSLAKSTKKGRDIDVNLFVEEVKGVIPNQANDFEYDYSKNYNYDSKEGEDDIEISDIDQLPF